MAYIDTKYLGKCETCRHHRSGKCDTWCDCGECYSPDMSKIPEADVVEVEHGYWVDELNGEYVGLNKMDGYPERSCTCSVCGDWLTGSNEYHCRGIYCPNCGAKMDREG